MCTLKGYSRFVVSFDVQIKMDSFFNLSPLNTTVSRKVISSYIKICSSSMERSISKHVELPLEQKWQSHLVIFSWLKLKQRSQHEIMNLSIFMLCVKICKCEIFSIRSNSAMHNFP